MKTIIHERTTLVDGGVRRPDSRRVRVSRTCDSRRTATRLGRMRALPIDQLADIEQLAGIAQSEYPG
jgi:hypothetical protein